VDQILDVLDADSGADSAGAAFTPPADFDLAGWWQRYQADFLSRLHRGDATVRLAPLALPRLTGASARAVAENGRPEPDGWTRAVLPIESLDHACAEFLALGPDIEVLDPPELRELLTTTIRAMLTRYEDRP
jgi:predicted DNA-binding transcriptional regulator YafY